MVRLAEGTLAALEPRGDSWTLRDTLPAGSPELFESGSLSIYSSEPAEMAVLAAAGLTCKPARILLMPLAPSQYRSGDWLIAGGDRR